MSRLEIIKDNKKRVTKIVLKNEYRTTVAMDEFVDVVKVCNYLLKEVNRLEDAKVNRQTELL